MPTVPRDLAVATRLLLAVVPAVLTTALLPATATAGPAPDVVRTAPAPTTAPTADLPAWGAVQRAGVLPRGTAPTGYEVLSDGTAVVVGDRRFTALREPGADAWRPGARVLGGHGCDVDGPAASSGTTVVVAYTCSARAEPTVARAAVRTPATGWVAGRLAAGPLWTGPAGQVGVGTSAYAPGTGWTTLPDAPFTPLALAADARGRLTAVGRAGASGRDLVTADLPPGGGWGPTTVLAHHEVRVRQVSLAVAPGGTRVVADPTEGLRVHRRVPGSGWDDRLVSTADGTVDVSAHVTPAGDAVVAWTTRRYTGAPGTDADAVTRLWATTGALGPVRRLSDPAGDPVTGLTVRSDDRGRLVAGWLTRDPAAFDDATSLALTGLLDGPRGTPVVVDRAPADVAVAIGAGGCALAASTSTVVNGAATRTAGPCASDPVTPADPRECWEPFGGTRDRGGPSFGDYRVEQVQAVSLPGGAVLAARTPGSGGTVVQRRDTDGWTRTDRLPCRLDQLRATPTGATAYLGCGYADGGTDGRFGPVTPYPTAPDDAGVVGVSATDDGDGDGDAVLAYQVPVDRRTLRGRVYVRDDGGAFVALPPSPVLRSDGTSTYVDRAAAGDVTLAVAGSSTTYDAAGGTWSEPADAPLQRARWSVADDGTVLVQTYGGFRYRVPGGPWSPRHPVPGAGPVLLSGDEVVGAVPDPAAPADGCGARPTALRVVATSTADGTTTGTTLGCFGTVDVGTFLAADAGGDAVVTGVPVRPLPTDTDTVWTRTAGGAWSSPATATGAYATRPVLLGDGRAALTTARLLDRRGSWLSVHDLG